MADQHEGIIPEEFANEWIQFEKNKNLDDGGVEGIKNILDSLPRLKRSTLISCWSIATIDSYALWRLYTKNKNAVAIKSNIQNLINALNIDPDTQYIGEVRYHTGNNYPGFRNAFDPSLFKWEYYKYESELRVVMTSEVRGTPPSNLRAKIDVNVLIDKIYLHPHSEQDELDLIEQILLENNIKKPVVKSGIREQW